MASIEVSDLVLALSQELTVLEDVNLSADIEDFRVRMAIAESYRRLCHRLENQ